MANIHTLSEARENESFANNILYGQNNSSSDPNQIQNFFSFIPGQAVTG